MPAALPMLATIAAIATPAVAGTGLILQHQQASRARRQAAEAQRLQQSQFEQARRDAELARLRDQQMQRRFQQRGVLRAMPSVQEQVGGALSPEAFMNMAMMMSGEPGAINPAQRAFQEFIGQAFSEGLSGPGFGGVTLPGAIGPAAEPNLFAATPNIRELLAGLDTGKRDTELFDFARTGAVDFDAASEFLSGLREGPMMRQRGLVFG